MRNCAAFEAVVPRQTREAFEQSRGAAGFRDLGLCKPARGLIAVNFHGLDKLMLFQKADDMRPILCPNRFTEGLHTPFLADGDATVRCARLKPPCAQTIHGFHKDFWALRKWSERQDLNLRRLAPKASALPG
jgi:hypothetical protein